MFLKIHAATRAVPVRKRPLVIGHRGTAGTVPENTLESFKQAVLDGADTVECDVRLSLDGEVIVMHDATVERTTNGSGPVATMTAAQLKALDAGYCFTTDGGKTFPFRGKGLKIPTLEELLKALPDVGIDVEIKADSPILVQKCVDLLRKYGRLSHVKLLVANADTRLAEQIRRLEPEAIAGHSLQEWRRFFILTRFYLPWLFKPKGTVIQVPARRGKVPVVTPRFVGWAHRLGMQVHVWTINEESDMRKYLAMGADALFTDYPGRMRKLVDSIL